MKKIGHQVLYLPTTETNPRNGEGTFARLKDGSILYAFTDYYDRDGEDHGIARISAVLSRDEGESWGERFVLLTMDEGDQNIMSPSLLRMGNGDLGIVYLRKRAARGGGLSCMPLFRRSADEGKSWSPWVNCSPEEGYFCAINDGALVLADGRIAVPMSGHGTRYGGPDPDIRPGRLYIALSGDDGASWDLMMPPLASPLNDANGLSEPGLYEYASGGLWLHCRTGYGFQYQSFAPGDGSRWSTPAPNFAFTSPDCPMRVKRLEGCTVAVFNPQPYTCLRTDREEWGSPRRTPLACAVSRDDGHSFSDLVVPPVNGALDGFTASVCLLEDDESNSYCYPSVFPVRDGFLVGYYHSGGTVHCLRDGKITKVLYSELER